MSRRSRGYRVVADTAQQVVGGFLLAGPFVVTEEVWVLAVSMSALQVAVTVGIVMSIGYATLYKADDRNPDRELSVAGIPLRFVSLMLVSYLSVFLLALAFDAPSTFLSEETGGDLMQTTLITLKATSVGAVFSVIGAATADSLF